MSLPSRKRFWSRAKHAITISVTVALVVTGLVVSLWVSELRVPESRLMLEGVETTVYAEQECGCCLRYIDYLREKGARVSVIYLEEEELRYTKEKLNIPPNLYSCHTGLINSYVVEGHLPASVIIKLVKEKPAILGVALPGMPSGSPGMGGSLREPLTVYAFAKDLIYVYVKVTHVD